MEEIKEEITENEYVSIAKFAELAGITKQAVYQRLNKDLSTYVKVDGKVKMVSTVALPLFAVKLNAKERPIETPVEQGVEQVDVKIEQADVKVEQENLKLIEYLKAENERLKRQIEEKDEIIAKKDEIIIGYTDRFANIAEQGQELTRNAQQLTRNAQQLHAMLALEPSKDEKESAPEPEGSIEKKKSFFGMFKRKQK